MTSDGDDEDSDGDDEMSEEMSDGIFTSLRRIKIQNIATNALFTSQKKLTFCPRVKRVKSFANMRIM